MDRDKNNTVEVVFLHLSGAASTRDFAVLFASPLFRDSPADTMRVLFDWRSLREWTLEDWSVLDAEQWAQTARPLARLALVHPTCWKRQAAMFAAILRRENVRVRSWKPEQMDAGLIWLLDHVESFPALMADRAP